MLMMGIDSKTNLTGITMKRKTSRKRKPVLPVYVTHFRGILSLSVGIVSSSEVDHDQPAYPEIKENPTRLQFSQNTHFT